MITRVENPYRGPVKILTYDGSTIIVKIEYGYYEGDPAELDVAYIPSEVAIEFESSRIANWFGEHPKRKSARFNISFGPYAGAEHYIHKHSIEKQLREIADAAKYQANR